MNLSIVSKTLAVFLFVISQAHAEGFIDSAASSAGNSSAAGNQTRAPILPSTDSVNSMYDRLTCTKPGDVGEGLSHLEGWKLNSDGVINTANAATAKCEVNASEVKTFIAASKKYSDNQLNCVNRNHSAGKNCLEKCSSSIQSMIAGSQAILAGISQTSITDSCSKMGQVLGLVQKGMAAFGVACGATKALCDYSCSSSVTGIKTADEALNKIVISGNDTVCAEYQAKIIGFKAKLQTIAKSELSTENSSSTDKKLSVADKKQECAGYVVNLGAAAMGLASAIQQGQKANECEKETKGDKTAALTAKSLAEKCSIATNKDLPECICKASPRSPGCELATNPSTNGVGGFGQLPGNGGGAGGTKSSLGDTGSNIPGYGSTDSSDSAGGAAPPMGGGGGASALGGGGTGSNDGRGQAEVEKKFNTDIYGGGGGGGGGAFGSRGGGPAAQNFNPALRDKIMAERDIASLRSQVSSQGGKSNFEKVKDRYIQEKTSLIGR